MENYPKVDNAPHSVTTLPPIENTEPLSSSSANPEAKKKSRRSVAIIAGLAASALAVGGYFTVKAINDGGNNEVPVDDPKTPVDVAPEPVENPGGENEGENGGEVVDSSSNQVTEHDPVVTPENSAELLASLQIKESASAEEKAAKILEISSRWVMAGATPALIEQQQQALIDANGVTAEDIAQKAALANRDVFAVAMYGTDWENNEYAREIVNTAVNSNAISLVRYMKTFGNKEFPNTNTQNREAYEESVSGAVLVDTADAETPVSTNLAKEIYNRASTAFGTKDIEVILFTGVRENNAESNMFGDNAEYAEVDGQTNYFSAVLVPDGTGNVHALHVTADTNESYSIPY